MKYEIDDSDIVTPPYPEGPKKSKVVKKKVSGDKLEAMLSKLLREEEKKAFWQADHSPLFGLKMLLEAFKQSRRASEYRKSVRGLVSSLWRGEISKNNFIVSFGSAIERFFTFAWEEGASACGIEPGELTEEEVEALDERIFAEQGYLPGFADWIVENNKASGKKLRDLMTRAAMWWDRYQDVKDQGMQVACSDMKARWVYDPELENCRDCENLDGRVYRMSVWAKYGLRPKIPELECEGFRCGCVFEQTDDPVTPGRPPNLVGK